jgi:hypothetical protein
MSNSYFSIFNHLDAPRKYYGATLLEMASVSSLVLSGFIMDKIAISLGLAVLSFKLVRVVSNSPKLSYYKKYFFFHSQDLKSGPKKLGRFFI